MSQGVSWNRIGSANAWAGTVAAAVHNGWLYTADRDGVLWATDLATGGYDRSGGAEWDSKHLLPVEAGMASIERDGNFYLSNPRDGTYALKGKKGAWSATRAATVLDAWVYTVDADGCMYSVDPTTGAWEQVGEDTDWASRVLVAADGYVYSIEDDGTLWYVDPDSGECEQIGKAGSYSGTRAAAMHQGDLYTADQDGKLYVTDVDTGSWQQVGDAANWSTRFLLDAGRYMVCIETDGSLYRVDVG